MAQLQPPSRHLPCTQRAIPRWRRRPRRTTSPCSTRPSLPHWSTRAPRCARWS